MSPPVIRRPLVRVCVPRASGDEPYIVHGGAAPVACSPRERG